MPLEVARTAHGYDFLPRRRLSPLSVLVRPDFPYIRRSSPLDRLDPFLRNFRNVRAKGMLDPGKPHLSRPFPFLRYSFRFAIFKDRPPLVRFRCVYSAEHVCSDRELSSIANGAGGIELDMQRKDTVGTATCMNLLFSARSYYILRAARSNPLYNPPSFLANLTGSFVWPIVFQAGDLPACRQIKEGIPFVTRKKGVRHLPLGV
ncbi:hypothetical protein DL93DRAFT_1682665 [Clavulina sp. PMI_390]|nr:hypothetical protein DL93DRAFT_1682665 [Clavulina sp. PMI_390]